MQAHQQLSKLFATLPVIYVLTFVAVTGGRAAAPPESFQAVRGRLIPSERLDGSMNINWNDLNSAFFSTTDEDTKVLLAFKGEILTASAQDRPPTVSIAGNARDSAYLIPGEAHQASEGEGIAYATITVTIKEIPIPSATIVDFGPDVPASIQYSSTMGQSIWVKGQKFAPNHTYIFKWKMFSANPVPCEGEVITNAEGSFDGTITLPAILPFGVQGKGQLHCYDKNSSIMITYRPFEIEKALL